MRPVTIKRGSTSLRAGGLNDGMFISPQRLGLLKINPMFDFVGLAFIWVILKLHDKIV
jgi:hypothetical protein